MKILKTVLITIVVLAGLATLGSCAMGGLFLYSADKAIDEMTDASDYMNDDSTEVDTSDMTVGQKNAYEDAMSYVGMWHESEKSVRDSLEYQEYEDADIEYAMSKLDVDWNLVAIDAAESYIDSGSFSYDGLKSQLTSMFDQFTDEQAEYAVDAINDSVNWTEEYVEAAKEYMEYGSYSENGLKEELEYDKFESADIEVALEAVGY